MTYRGWILFSCLTLTLGVAGQPDQTRGVVFLDADGDGARDPGERGLAGIVVSDQIAVTTTGAEGRYALPGTTS